MTHLMSHFYESHVTYATFVTCLLLRHAVMKSTHFINNYSFLKWCIGCSKIKIQSRDQVTCSQKGDDPNHEGKIT